MIHLLLSTKDKVVTNVDSTQIENSHSEKLVLSHYRQYTKFRRTYKNSPWESKFKLVHSLRTFIKGNC